MADLDIRKKTRVEDRTQTGGMADEAVATTHRPAEHYEMMQRMDDPFRGEKSREDDSYKYKMMYEKSRD